MSLNRLIRNKSKKYNSKRLTGEIYFYLPLFFILVPSFPSFLPETLGFQLIFIMEVVISAYLYKRYYKPQIENNSLIIAGYFFLSTLFSLFNDSINNVVIYSDLFELAKPVAFLLFYWLYRYSTIEVEVIEKQTIRSICTIFACLSLFSILSFIFPSIFHPIEYLLYKRENMPVHIGKAIGSFSQTYHFAYSLLLPLSLSFLHLITNFKIKYFLFFIAILSTMLLTQSRSMYISSALCILICIILPIHYKSIRRTKKMLSVIVLLVAIVWIIVSLYIEDIASNLSYAIDGFSLMLQGENNSVNVRQSQVQWVIENNPYLIIGAGIGKGEIMLESLYSLYYYRYGALGLLLSLGIMINTGIKAYKVAQKEYRANLSISLFYYSLSIFYFISPIATLSSCHMDSPKISFIYYGFMGMIFAKYKKIKHYEFLSSQI